MKEICIFVLSSIQNGNVIQVLFVTINLMNCVIDLLRSWDLY